MTGEINRGNPSRWFPARESREPGGRWRKGLEILGGIGVVAEFCLLLASF